MDVYGQEHLPMPSLGSSCEFIGWPEWEMEELETFPPGVNPGVKGTIY